MVYTSYNIHVFREKTNVCILVSLQILLTKLFKVTPVFKVTSGDGKYMDWLALVFIGCQIYEILLHTFKNFVLLK